MNPTQLSVAVYSIGNGVETYLRRRRKYVRRMLVRACLSVRQEPRAPRVRLRFL